MFRQSDHNCTGKDSAPPEEKNKKFLPKMDCLSKESSQMVIIEDTKFYSLTKEVYLQFWTNKWHLIFNT